MPIIAHRSVRASGFKNTRQVYCRLVLSWAKHYKDRVPLGKRSYFTLPRLDQVPFLIHGFGTRDWIVEDLRRLPQSRGFEILFLDQVHSAAVHIVDRMPAENPEGDAAITSLPRVFLVIKTADCLPLFLVDEGRKVIAAVHCGWRGTAKRLALEVVALMAERFGSEPSSLIAAMGPVICSRCYEVGEDVRRAFVQKKPSRTIFLPHPVKEGKYFMDLKAANRVQLFKAGILPQNIHSLDLCTLSRRDLISHRQDQKTKARMLNFIGIRNRPD